MASTLLVLGLLGGTAGAFAWTERLKVQPSPITRPRVDHGVAPGCGCRFAVATVSFGLREADTVTLSIVDADDEPVREIASSRLPAGFRTFAWNGRDDAGRVVPEATYKPQLHLADERRTITLPAPIVVDTTPPTIAVLGVGTRVISPDGDRRGVGTTIRYRMNERGWALLLVRGVVEVRDRAREPKGALHWYGKGRDRRGLPPGRYQLFLAAEDRLRNRSRPVSAGTVRIRYIELAANVIRARVGSRVRVGVATDAARYRWRLAGRTGTARGPVLRIRAPRRGRHTLLVEANGHADRAVVIVRGRR